MPSQIFTVLSAVVPALLVLLTEQVFNLIRDKRASRERLMYYFLPKRLEFYRGLLTFIAENLSRRKSAQFLSASDVQSEALDLNEEVIKLHTAAVCCASMSVASTPVLLSSGLLALQEECDHAPVDELVEEFRGLLSAAKSGPYSATTSAASSTSRNPAQVMNPMPNATARQNTTSPGDNVIRSAPPRR